MEATLKRAGIDCYNKLFEQSVSREESLDSVVPDTLPDIKNILLTNGNVLIRSKDVSAGRIRIEANVPAKVSYVPDGESGIVTLDVNIHLFASVENELIEDGDFCCVELCLSELDARMLNPRKITTYALVNFKVTAWRRGEMNMPCGVEDENIKTLSKKAYITAVSAVCEKTFIITDECEIPASKPAATEIIGHSTRLTAEEIKNVGAKAIVKGSVESNVVYITEGNTICSCSFTSSFSQIIDSVDAEGEPDNELKMLSSGVYYEIAPGGSGRTVSMEIHAVAQLTASEKREVEYIADAYSCAHELDINGEKVEISSISRRIDMRETLNETIRTRLPAAEIASVIAEQGEVMCDSGEIRIVIRVCIVYRSDEGELMSEKSRLTLRLNQELAWNESIFISSVSMGEAHAIPDSEGIQLSIPFAVCAKAMSTESINQVCSCCYDEESVLDLSSKPAIVVVGATDRTDLWAIAKENYSTVEAIVQVNKLDECAGAWEKYILVPKML